MQSLDTKIQKSRVQLLLRYPFFGTIVLKRPFVADPTCPTSYTDGNVIGYNPEWADKLTVGQLIGLWAHEGSHIARKHHLRRNNRDPLGWNGACDHQINLNLISDNFELPEGALADHQYDGMSADQIYAKLPKGGQGQGGGSGDGEGQGKPYNGTDLDEVRDWPGNGNGNGGKPTQSDMDAESQKIDGEVIQAATMAQKRGNMPGGFERLIDNIKNPLVDWRHLLRQYVQASAKDDHTWKRPNRRFAWQGLYLPSLFSEKIGELVIAVDTSGSTYSYQEQFIGEVASIARELRPERLHLLYCDSAVSAETYDNMDDLQDFKPKGGGGTSFVPVFNWVDENGVKPVCLVYLTDMCGEFPEQAPDYPVIWVDSDNVGGNPFGDWIPLEG